VGDQNPSARREQNTLLPYARDHRFRPAVLKDETENTSGFGFAFEFIYAILGHI
jgi:hypothetical protein